MTSSPQWIPSKRLQSAAKSERKRIEREIAKLNEQEARHQRELARIDARRAGLESELTAVDRFAASQAEGPQLRIVGDAESSSNTMLKGVQIREFAVQLIVGTEQARHGIHYRTWFELVTANGIELSGKDPLAVFLTQMSRSPVVVKTDRPGEYVIDETFPQKATSEIVHIDTRIRELSTPDPMATIEEIEEKRRLVKEGRSRIRSLERALAEAERSLLRPSREGTTIGDSPTSRAEVG